MQQLCLPVINQLLSFILYKYPTSYLKKLDKQALKNLTPNPNIAIQMSASNNQKGRSIHERVLDSQPHKAPKQHRSKHSKKSSNHKDTKIYNQEQNSSKINAEQSANLSAQESTKRKSNSKMLTKGQHKANHQNTTSPNQQNLNPVNQQNLSPRISNQRVSQKANKKEKHKKLASKAKKIKKHKSFKKPSSFRKGKSGKKGKSAKKQQSLSDKILNSRQDQQTVVRGQVKEEQRSDSESSSQSEIRQCYIAKRLHAYRDELQIMEIDENQQSAKSYRSIKTKQSQVEGDTPTEDQIEQLLQVLRESYPHRNNKLMLEMLYKCLIKKDSKGNDCRSIQEQLLKGNDATAAQKYSKLIKNLESNLRVLAEKPDKNITKRYIKNPKSERVFLREEERVKFLEKQVVAKAFCNREYGMPALLDELRESACKIIIERNRYKTLVTCVVSEAYRKLQEFLIDQCRREIKPLNRQEIRSIYTTLLNCRTNFDNDDSLTFLKFMKLAFEVQSVTITEQAAVKLYIVVQRALKLRIGELQLDRMYDTMRCNKEFKARRSFQNERFQIHRIWNNELESEFLGFYKSNQEFAKIRDHFKGKYSDHQQLFTIDALRSRFNKILRMALRKTTCFCQKFGQERVPQMVKLNDLKVKFLLRSPEALNARLLLVDMYLYDECDIRRLYQTVSAVNEFIIMKDNERMNQMIEAEPLFSSVTAKVNHNVAISKHHKNSQLSPQHTYYKGKHLSYDHIVQNDHGQNLHYFRKPHITTPQPTEPKLQTQAGGSAASRLLSEECLEKRMESEWMKQRSSSRDLGSETSQQILQTMIREEMEKYNSKSLDSYSAFH